jgi:hypothetical protein
MRTVASFTIATLVSLGGLACTDSGTTAPRSTTDGSALSPASAPAASGPLVIRFESGYPIIASFDLADGLLAVHIARDGFAGCGEPFTVFRPGLFQDVSSPTFQDLVTELFRAEVFVTVYPWEGQDIEADPCGFLLNTPRIARGTAHLLRTDNNLFGAAAPRANAFGYAVEGLLELTAGGQAHYSTVSRGVAVPAGGVLITEDITLVPLR